MTFYKKNTLNASENILFFLNLGVSHACYFSLGGGLQGRFLYVKCFLKFYLRTGFTNKVCVTLMCVDFLGKDELR